MDSRKPRPDEIEKCSKELEKYIRDLQKIIDESENTFLYAEGMRLMDPASINASSEITTKQLVDCVRRFDNFKRCLDHTREMYMEAVYAPPKSIAEEFV
ncbi:MAG: hypothetical protein NC223_11230 [Butyrivibrio sp.]|nr:hypothetical protein [Butyrivibrio sp.]